ncbi:putative P450 monooxygenase [Hortaea werneckii]|nr:putative P450 monooxygenase [Hortaea werneckii]
MLAYAGLASGRGPVALYTGHLLMTEELRDASERTPLFVISSRKGLDFCLRQTVYRSVSSIESRLALADDEIHVCTLTSRTALLSSMPYRLGHLGNTIALLLACIQREPPIWSIDFDIWTENVRVAHHPPAVPANLGASGSELVNAVDVDNSSAVRYHLGHETGDRGIDAKTLFDTSLEIGQLTSFRILDDRSADLTSFDCSVRLSKQTLKDWWRCRNVVQSHSQCRCCTIRAGSDLRERLAFQLGLRKSMPNERGKHVLSDDWLVVETLPHTISSKAHHPTKAALVGALRKGSLHKRNLHDVSFEPSLRGSQKDHHTLFRFGNILAFNERKKLQ